MARFHVMSGIVAVGILLAAVTYQSRIVEAFYSVATTSTSPTPIPVYIVSLPSRKTERLDPLLSKLFGKSGTYDIYDMRDVVGIDGRAVVVESFLSKGQIGCWLSHAKIWSAIAKHNDPYALVLEDDALISRENAASIQEILEEIPSDWSVCYLGGRYADPTDAVVVKHLKETRNLEIAPTSRIWHSHAYIIKKSAATRLLEMSSPFNTSRESRAFTDTLPLDDWMTDPGRGLKVYKVEPELIPFKRDDISDT